MKLNVIVLSYTAGIIDGEGCIDIYKHKTDSRSIRPYRFTMRVTVVMGSVIIPNWLAGMFGGNVLYTAPKKDTRSAEWRWSLASQKALSFLRLIKPYMHLKEDQAEIAINFQSGMKPSGWYGNGKARKTDAQWQREESLWVALKQIRGRKHL